jgi:hypothetical protein
VEWEYLKWELKRKRDQKVQLEDIKSHTPSQPHIYYHPIIDRQYLTNARTGRGFVSRSAGWFWVSIVWIDRELPTWEQKK